MTAVGFNTFVKKAVNTVFIVKNISFDKRSVSLFNLNLKHNESYDLLKISYLSEADIRHSLLKGILRTKLLDKEIIVTDSSIDLLQFASEQREFLIESGITDGIDAISTPIDVLVYRPGVPSNNGVASTWAEVNAFANNAQLRWRLVCDPLYAPCEVPADADTDFRNICIIRFILGPNDSTLLIKDGGKIKNMEGVEFGSIVCEAITTAGVHFDSYGVVFILERGGTIANTAGSLVPAVQVDVSSLVIASAQSGGFRQNAIVELIEYTEPNGQYILAQLLNSDSGQSVFPENSIIIDGSSLAISLHDGTGTLGSQTSIDGTIIDIPIENSNYIGWQSGDTASRPTGYTIGQPYFDTSLGHPIWWSGANWVDSTGGIV